ncbi:MAG: hypothetical protein HY654_10655, partial [Acidobacteria bacterium]|nr:hypothetical protein [Acidobacteriota bacterium]
RVTAPLVATLAGRTSLVLGGGYLLRALTETGLIARPVGIALGFAYALLWLALADRAGGSEKRVSAIFHALAAAAIAFPLLYESIVKFGLLGAWAAVAGMTVTLALGLLVAWRRWLESVVWIFSAAAIATAAVLIWTHADKAPFGLHLVVVAAATYGVAISRSWTRVLWPVALVANLAAILVARDALLSQDPAAATLALVTASVLLATTIAAFATRVIAARANATPFEIVQSAAALLVGGAIIGVVLRVFGLNGVPFGTALVAAGGIGYALAFAVTTLTRHNFHYLASVALALVIAGGILVFRPTAAASLWIALAIAGTWAGRQQASTTLAAHGAAYLVSAGVASGLIAATGRGLAGTLSAASVAIAPASWLALAAAVVCAAIAPVSVRTFGGHVGTIAGRRWSVGLPRAVALSLVALGFSAVAILWIGSTALASGRDIAWSLATVRTTVLAIAVMLMGVLARGGRVREAGWLIYPLLILLGVKILFEDFRVSDPAMLFVALVVYGTALIFAPRVASRTG